MTRRDPLRLSERELIALAVKLIEADRRFVVDSYAGRELKVTDRDALIWIRAYDRFLRPARDWLRRHS